MSGDKQNGIEVKKPIRAYFYNGRVVVWSTEDSRRLYAMGFYGKPLGIRKPKGPDFEAPLELSPFEAVYLLEKGEIEVYDGSRKLSPRELFELYERKHHLFADKYLVYKDLRDKGFVVRSGMKFGVCFSVYKYGPGVDHAPFLVEVLPSTSKLDPIQIVRAGRLSHSVKKRFVIATIDEKTKKIRYLVFKWFKA